MRLIDADKLYPDRMTKDGLAISQSQIANAPTVEERPHGEWVLDKEFSFVLNIYECSKCRFNGSKRWHFCPNCGSDNRPRILDEAVDGEGKDGNVKEGEAE